MASIKCATDGCDTTLPETATICPNCAQIVLSPHVAVFPRTTPPPHSEHDEQTSTCPICGAAEQRVNCTICGSSLTAAPQPAAPASGALGLLLPDGSRVPLAEGTPVVIGRDSEITAIAHALNALDTVSRRHVQVTVQGDRVEIADLGSANGTYVNDRKLGSAPIVRESPVRLGLGRSVTLEIQ